MRVARRPTVRRPTLRVVRETKAMQVDDLQAMQIAIKAADRARLVSRPNPWVGAVVVARTGQIFEGSTSRPGLPHAEVMALTLAGDSARNATIYTTLEPCC
ncbi:MAG: hypothetical protein ACKOGG_06450, partial [Actinomycetota bacterium]